MTLRDPRWLCVLILLTGCAAKKNQITTQYVPPECVRMRPAGDCPLTADGGLDPKTCKVHYEILCIKIKENK